MIKTFLPYPGGKAKLAPHIIAAIDRHEFTEYREPFVGGGAIGLHYATESHADCWFNDKDIGIYSLWESVANHHEELIDRVREFLPSLDQFDYVKEFFAQPITSNDPVEIGLNKLALHKMSFSGLGERGTAKGGRHQSRFQVADYWSSKGIIERIQYAHDRFEWREMTITNLDYSQLIAASGGRKSNVMLYCDPPYYTAGPFVYRHFFEDADHVRLRDLLKASPHNWVLSYDDCPRIHDLYSGWADIEVLDVVYCIANHSGHPANRTQEILITPRSSTVH